MYIYIIFTINLKKFKITYYLILYDYLQNGIKFKRYLIFVTYGNRRRNE